MLKILRMLTLSAGVLLSALVGAACPSHFAAGDTNYIARLNLLIDCVVAGAGSPLSTKGDLWGYSTVNARIPVGANGRILTADSAQTLGVDWKATLDGVVIGGTTPANGTFADLTATGNIGASDKVSLANTAKFYLFERTQPAGPPPSGIGHGWYDSTSKTLKISDDAGANSTTVRADAGSSNNFLTAISASGVVSKAQPAFTNLSGSVAASQMPALTGDVTTSAGAVATTLATVNSNVGAFTNANITVNAKGLVTAAASGSSSGIMPLQCLRLYAVTASPVPVGDTTTVSTIYVGPHQCDTVTLLDGSDAYVNFTLTEKSLALSGLTSGKPYDVWLYSNSGTLTVELSAAWTNDTTRSDAVATVKGLVVKSSDHLRLHVGTIYTTSTTSTQDTAAKRFVWNRYNQNPAFMRVQDSTATWTYTAAGWRQANGSTANQLDFVTGDCCMSVVDVSVIASARNSVGSVDVGAAIGVDGVTPNTSTVVGYATTPPLANAYVSLRSMYTGKPALGRHYITWLEFSNATGVTTWVAGTGPAYSGIQGSILN